MEKRNPIQISEDGVVVHHIKNLIHFSRPRVGIEEDMTPDQLENHIRLKFRRWKQ